MHLSFYSSDIAAGDAKNEVPITNVAKIKFPGSPRKKTGSGELIVHVFGIYDSVNLY